MSIVYRFVFSHRHRNVCIAIAGCSDVSQYDASSVVVSSPVYRYGFAELVKETAFHGWSLLALYTFVRFCRHSRNF